MLEEFVIVAAAERLRSCVIGVHLDAFCARLADLGYRSATIRQKLWVISSLTSWMANEDLTVADLDERCVGEFLEARRRRGRTHRGFRRTLLQLLEQLRCAGVVHKSRPAHDDSPVITLLARYEAYLREQHLES